MPTPPTIVGFASSNHVPGFYGETVYGAGAISAASIPLTLLIVGTKLSTGSAVENQDIDSILDANTADTLYGAGSELALGCYAALKVPGVTIKAAAVPEGGSAAAATLTVTIAGTWTTTGTLTYRINGEQFQITVGASDSVSTVATNIRDAYNQDPRRPCLASASAGVVTFTVRSKGARGNQYICFQDTSAKPTGLTSTLGGGGSSVTGGGLTFASGSATDSVTTLLALIIGQKFDRICYAGIDSTNLALWKAQLTTQAGPTSNITQHFVSGIAGTLSAAITLATVSLNAERMELLHYLNSETNPFVAAAYFAALRCATEQTDPDAAYDDVVLPIAPQSQRADWPSNATLQTALNNGVTPIKTSSNGAEAQICRAITTHSLTGSTPDYRTLDTSDAYVPDFVRTDIALFWTTVFKPNNPRVADDPPPDVKELVSGIATPKNWNASVEKKLRNYEKGVLESGGSGATNPTVAPIVIDVDDNKPFTVYDGTKRCLVGVIPVVPAPNNHQIGVSVRNVTSV